MHASSCRLCRACSGFREHGARTGGRSVRDPGRHAAHRRLRVRGSGDAGVADGARNASQQRRRHQGSAAEVRLRRRCEHAANRGCRWSQNVLEAENRRRSSVRNSPRCAMAMAAVHQREEPCSTASRPACIRRTAPICSRRAFRRKAWRRRWCASCAKKAGRRSRRSRRPMPAAKMPKRSSKRPPRCRKTCAAGVTIVDAEHFNPTDQTVAAQMAKHQSCQSRRDRDVDVGPAVRHRDARVHRRRA